MWWKYYHHLGDLHILIVSVANIVQCIAPFYISQVRFLTVQSVRAIKFIGTGGDTSPDDLDVLYNPKHAKLTLDAVCNTLISHTYIELFQLKDVPNNSVFLNRFLTLTEKKGLPFAQITEQKRRVMALPESMDSYLASLTRNTRKRIKTRQRKLDAEADIEFHVCTKAEHIESTLNDLIRLNRARHNGKGHSKSFNTSSYNRFHLELMHTLLPLGQLRLIKVQYQGQTIGVEYGFQIGGTLSFFQTGFDPAFEWLSPGHIMMLRMIEESIADGATEIDLLKGNYDYKNSYAKHWRITLCLDLWVSPAHSIIKSVMESLRQAKVTPSWRQLLSDDD